jgi:hypothetical protein
MLFGTILETLFGSNAATKQRERNVLFTLAVFATVDEIFRHYEDPIRTSSIQSFFSYYESTGATEFPNEYRHLEFALDELLKLYINRVETFNKSMRVILNDDKAAFERLNAEVKTIANNIIKLCQKEIKHIPKELEQRVNQVKWHLLKQPTILDLLANEINSNPINN